MRPDTTPELVTEAVAELIALGAAIASNNQEAFQRHNFRLHRLGVAREDRIQAVNIALQVKMAPHRNLVEMAEAYLMGGEEPTEGGCGGGCGCSGEEEGCCDEGGCGEGGCGCGA
ncbi:hypothetical protein [Mesoterricola sediminis]|uniref:Uncharacterized protein n=1 Tax=Mesoterricola sediminis TaxID=2927980 RepID=A0AA48GZY7_9BACT|nr:hypothetical protein [Mesoterricola sediminis]BDU77132.1 hypothetical protein METESE_20900 [Mesoterricola sediminis]